MARAVGCISIERLLQRVAGWVWVSSVEDLPWPFALAVVQVLVIISLLLCINIWNIQRLKRVLHAYLLWFN